jgi:RpiB/LacA/LacB family sugar-phosphate isomerase
MRIALQHRCGVSWLSSFSALSILKFTTAAALFAKLYAFRIYFSCIARTTGRKDYFVVPKSDTIVIGSDHAGYELKEYVKTLLKARGIPFEDVGTKSAESTDYPIWAGKVALHVSQGTYARGITVCGSGIGASIAANRFKGVRAGLCVTPEMARLAREHNNANVLVLGGRILSQQEAEKILDTWLNTDFAAGRHERRAKQLDDMESTARMGEKD